MADLRHMTLGQVVDYCITFNRRQEKAEAAQEKAEKHKTKRPATQADIDAFFG